MADSSPIFILVMMILVGFVIGFIISLMVLSITTPISFWSKAYLVLCQVALMWVIFNIIIKYNNEETDG